MNIGIFTIWLKRGEGGSGPFSEGRLPLETRKEVLQIIDIAKAPGTDYRTTCNLLQISIRRVERLAFGFAGTD